MYKILSLLLLTSFAYAQMINGVAILVKKEPITLFDIQKEMRSSNQELNAVVDNLIRKKLEAQEIKERHIKVDSEEVYKDLRMMAEQNHMTLSQLYNAMLKSRGLSELELKAKIKEKILNQKLYGAIAFSKMSQPSEEDELAYYKQHIDKYSYSKSFSVIVYSSSSKEKLQEKIDNPMFYSPKVRSEPTELDNTKLNPQIAQILAKTPVDRFTPIIPAPGNMFMSFFIQKKSQQTETPFEQVRADVNGAIMQERRQSVLNEYFMRLRMNADIEIIRLPES
jgi:parvulin-like peptidyl-prolyl isomerase